MTINSSTRIAGPYTGNGSTTAFPFSFKVFSTAEVTVVQTNLSLVETTLTLGTNYTVSLNANQNSNPGGTVNMVTAPASGFLITLTSSLGYTQTLDLTNQGGFYPSTINDALDRATIQIQQLNEQVGRAAKVNISSGTDSTALVNNINTVAANLSTIQAVNSNQSNINTVSSNSSSINTVSTNNSNISTVASNITAVNTAATNITAIQNASTNASNAASSASAASTSASSASTSASNASTSATNAATSATSASGSATTATTQASAASTSATNAASSASSAATSATAAAASAASGMYSAVQDKSANYTVLAADAGDLIRVTTTSGAVTLTLPTISTVGDGFKIAIVKWTSDGNAVSVVRSGSDTINGGTSYSLGNQYSSATFVADLETAQWFAVASGIGVSNVNVDVFSGNASTVAFTLSGDPGSRNNTLVEISGVYQQKSTYTVSGTTLTFSTAPPTGTSNIEVVWTAPLAIGTPSDGTVSPAKLSTGGLNWDVNGNVGIGTTSPTQKLQVHGSSGSDVYTRISNTDSTTSSGLLLGLNGNEEGIVRVETNQALSFGTNNTERMRITSGGDVGIGTTSPSKKLEVWATSNSLQIQSIVRNDNTGTGVAAIGFNVSGSAGAEATSTKAGIGLVRSNAYGVGSLCFYNNITTSAGDFTTADERMRIDSSGNLLVGLSSNYFGEKILAYQSSTTAPATFTYATSGSFTGSVCVIQSEAVSGTAWKMIDGRSQAGTARFYVFGNGTAQNSTGTYTTISDAKLKENIVDANPQLDKLMQTRVVNYNLIDDDLKQIGWVAQELETIFPSMVFESPDKTPEGEDLGTTTKGVKLTVFVPIIVKAIQEQQALITALAARLTALEN